MERNDAAKVEELCNTSTVGGNGESAMNAYRKLGIVVIGALASMAIGLTPAFAQSHGGGGHAGGGGAHYAAGGHTGAYGGGYGGHYAGGGYRGGAYYGRGGSYYGRGGAYYGRGYYGGGYWHGGFWYGPRFGYGWFLPILPAFYATYWFGGIPYYYANDSYYTWSPDYNGYVQTDPPAGAVPDDGSAAPPPGNAAPPPGGAAPPPSGQTYDYPKNGQNADQEANDRYQCHQWAVSQSGYDPTRNNPGSAGQPDYTRALSACMQGRGYTVR